MEKHGDVKLWHGDALHASRRYSNPEQGFAVRRHGGASRSRGKAMQGEATARHSRGEQYGAMQRHCDPMFGNAMQGNAGSNEEVKDEF